MALYRCMVKASGGQMVETVLWTNPDPSASAGFSQQTVTLSDDIDNYNFICVEYARMATVLTTIIKVYYKVSDYKTFGSGNSARGSFNFGSNNRTFYYVSDTELRFNTCYPTGSTTVVNNYCIPLNIYGCK